MLQNGIYNLSYYNHSRFGYGMGIYLTRFTFGPEAERVLSARNFPTSCQSARMTVKLTGRVVWVVEWSVAL